MIKKRTENKVKNAVISCMRRAFTRYSPKIKEVLLKNRIEVDQYNKDGSLSKRKRVLQTCTNCNKYFKVKDIHIDHIVPVIPLDKVYADLSLDDIFSRLDCNIDNLCVLCVECHKNKSKEENRKRREYRKNK